MEVIRDECPRIAGCLCLSQNQTQPVEKVFPVFIIIKDSAPLYSPHDDVMQGSGRVYA